MTLSKIYDFPLNIFSIYSNWFFLPSFLDLFYICYNCFTFMYHFLHYRYFVFVVFVYALIKMVQLLLMVNPFYTLEFLIPLSIKYDPSGSCYLFLVRVENICPYSFFNIDSATIFVLGVKMCKNRVWSGRRQFQAIYRLSVFYGVCCNERKAVIMVSLSATVLEYL